MNNRGQVFFFTLMLAAVVIVLALALVYPVRQSADEARAVSTDSRQGMDCGNSSISRYDKAGCVMVDMATPYFFFGLLGIAGIVVGAKLAFGGS